MIRPVELALGEPHVDTRSGPPPGLLSGDAFLFAEKWAAAADALARDPVLALAPLRALRDRRFVRPRPGANGWPDAAVPTLFAALDASRSCAAASPTLAGEIWGTAAGLLAAWARWHAPRSVVSETIGAGGAAAAAAAAAAATLSRVVDVVAAARDAFSSVGFHVPGGPLGPMSALCLACVAASPAAPRETRARALASALETLDRLAPENAFASAAEARALAASFAYACAAAEETHTATHAVELQSAHGDDRRSIDATSTSLARVFFPLWRNDGFFSSGNAEILAQRAGLLLARAARATARLSFPRIAASLARNARDVLVRSERLLKESPRGGGVPLAIPRFPDGHSGAAFVAAGILLACRRPVPDGAEATALYGHVSRPATALDALDALRVAEAHAAEAVAAAAAVSAALAADDALADAVADARSRGVSFPSKEGVSNHEISRTKKKTDATVAETSLVAAAWSALAAGALSASRCVAERVFDSDASSHVEHAHARSIDIDIDIDASGRRVGKQTCFFAVVSGAYRFAAAPLLVAAKCARARTDPASASAAVASARAAPLAANAHALIDLACGELARGWTRGEALSPQKSARARFASRATARFARDAHEGYTFFLASTPAEWRGALDPTSVWPALADARLAVVVACEHLTALALEEDASRRMGNDIETLHVSLSVAACDALAYVEFARAFDAHMSRRGQIATPVTPVETKAVYRAQMGSARYALALTRLAAALGADSPAGAAFRKRFALESVPEVPREGLGSEYPSANTLTLPMDSRANVFLRLVPYFASGAFGDAPGFLVTARALPLAAHYASHQSPGFARAAHLALAASFRAAPAATVPDAFAPYVERSLERLYASGAEGVFSLDAARASAKKPVEEAFASTVLVVAECGGATRRSRDAVAAAARALVERAKRLDAFSFSSDVDTNAENVRVRIERTKNARTLRRLVFALLPLVDHALVPDIQSAAEEAVLSVCPYRRRLAEENEEENGGGTAPRLAAYADLVRSVMAIGDVARKGAATQWALRLRARL